MKHFLHSAKGLSLLELLLVISIIAIIAAFAVPSVDSIVKATRQRSTLSELISLINLARNTAIQEQVVVTLCPLTAEKKCGSDWSRPLAAFRDPNRTKTVSNGSQVLRVVQLNTHGSLTGHAGIRNYFRFRPTGFAEEAIGNIVWCPSDRDNQYASQVRINMGGRPLVSKDFDGDGVPEDTYGLNLQCN